MNGHAARFAAVALGLPTLMAALAIIVPADDAAPPLPTPGSLVNVLGYGAKGDGKTDDAPAIQKALDANPGKTVVLPDRRPNDVPDYVCSRTLVLKDPGQVLRGDGAGYAMGVVIKFPPGVDGVRFASTAQGALLKDLILEGSESWWGSYAAEAVLPDGFGGKPGASSADGVKIGANFARCDNVTARRFGRHGFNVADDETWGDNFYIANCYAMNNRGCGLHVKGGDSNAGATVQFRAYANQLWGIYDRSFLGNTHISPQTHSNHWDGTPGGAATKVWEAAGDDASGGPYKSGLVPNIGNLWICPYAEADQPPSVFSHKDIVIGGDLGSGVTGIPFRIRTGEYPLLPFVGMTNGRDEAAVLRYKAGSTTPQDLFIRTLDPKDNVLWDELRGPKMMYLLRGGERQARYLFNSDGTSDFNSYGTAPLRINVQEGSGTGGLQVGDGSRRVVAAITSKGAVSLEPVKDSEAPARSIFVGEDGRWRVKDAAGKVALVGGDAPARPIIRKQGQATIERGKTSVVIEHGLGDQPAPEDVAIVIWGPQRVWLAGTSDKTLTFRTDGAAPAAGTTFTYSASRQP